MYRSKESINTEINTLLKDLYTIAREDNIISLDEKFILDEINQGLKNLQIQVFQILESNLSDEEFNDILIDLLHDIIDNVVKTAEADGVITGDEKKLVDRIYGFVQSNEGGVNHN